MKFLAAKAVLLLCSLAQCAFASDAEKETPIQRVVKLLGEMKVQLETEAAEDATAFDKMVCWCETNQKEKTTAIADADSKITQLLSEVEERAGSDGSLSTKIAHLKEELAERKASLATATKIREEELGSFNGEESESVQAITMLKNAVSVLGKHNAGLIQFTPEIQESISATLRWVALKHQEMLEMRFEHNDADLPDSKPLSASLLSLGASVGLHTEEGAILKALRGGAARKGSLFPAEYAAQVLAKEAASGVRRKAGSLVQQPLTQSYAPQSGAIFGILKQMQEEFEANLSQSQKDEMKAREEYAALKEAAEKSITAGAKKLDELEAEFAGNEKALSDAKEDLTATREARAGDVKFLSDVRLECQELKHQMEVRTKGRGQEIKAVAETIAILTEDDARTLFHKKMGTGGAGEAPAFLQVSQTNTAQLAARSRASRVLLAAAGRLQQSQVPDTFMLHEDKPHEQLAAIALSVQLDAFVKVKKAIDDMVTQLKAEQDEEVKHKEYCRTDLDENEKQTYTTQQALADVQDKIESLKATIEKLMEEIATAHAEIAEMEIQIKRAGEDRKGENDIFQEEVGDQRAMQQILAKAVDRLRQVYTKKALVQEDPRSPVQFKEYKQDAGSSPVIGMMEQIIEDSKASEKDTMAAEQASQTAYATFVNDSNAVIKGLNAAIESKEKAKTSAGVDLAQADGEEKSTQDQLQSLGQIAADLHEQCDFVVKNFDIRQKARQQEIEALQGAKAFLSGMSDNN